MNTSDYYGEARIIAANLKNAGREADGTNLIDAIEAGATATEILMALRFHLMNLLADQSLPTIIRSPTESLYKRINSVLS
jgi:hypothetical protein